MTPEVLRTLGIERYKVSHLIYHFLRSEAGYSGARLARELGCSTANVSKTITGVYHSGMVLDALRVLGVPEAYLFDPRKQDEPEPLSIKLRKVANG